MDLHNWDGHTGWLPDGTEVQLHKEQAKWVDQLTVGFKPDAVFSNSGKQSGKTVAAHTAKVLLNNTIKAIDGSDH